MIWNAIEIGPFVVQNRYIVLLISAVVSYIAVKIMINNKEEQKTIVDVLFNTAAIALIIWKFSYGIFHPIETINAPVRILYFSGGFYGMLLGGAAAALYLYRKIKLETISAHTWVIALGTVMTSFLFAYELSVWVISDFEFTVSLVKSIVALLFLIALFMHRSLVIYLLTWFFMMETGITFFQARSTVFLDFSMAQLLYIGAALILLFLPKGLKN